MGNKPGVSLGVLVATVSDHGAGQGEEFFPPRQESGSVCTQLCRGFVDGNLCERKSSALVSWE